MEPELAGDPGDRHDRQRGALIAGAVAFTLACVAPTIFFLIIGYSSDETAERTVSAGSLLTLIAIELVVGAAIGLVTWAVVKAGRGTARAVFTTILLVGAAGWGFITGFLGAVGIAYERHPGWDDA